MKSHRFIYGVVLLAALIWCLLIVLAPLLARSEGVGQTCSFFTYLGFSKICHQLDARSFHILGFKLAVCARCTGIYLGFFFGLLLLPFLRKISSMNLSSQRTFLIALAPLCLDYGLDVLGIFQNSLASRSITGFLVGAVLALFLMPLAASGIRELLSKPYKPITF